MLSPNLASVLANHVSSGRFDNFLTQACDSLCRFPIKHANLRWNLIVRFCRMITLDLMLQFCIHYYPIYSKWIMFFHLLPLNRKKCVLVQRVILNVLIPELRFKFTWPQLSFLIFHKIKVMTYLEIISNAKW